MLSQIFWVKQVAIVQLDMNDFTQNNFASQLTRAIEGTIHSKVVFDLSSSESVSTHELKQLEKVTELLRLNGIESKVCGLHPMSAALLVHFTDDINLDFALNVDAAIDAITA